ncbi:type II secretion system protein [Candidatus Albibeggiatoa sp. nov. NOAA]|uniref:type II secretion system protein n=1 Tax=Candidatus Albibeggiatoa sp. nov. NOAA TaxID=3162724 RepID=UPI0033036452|nr:type II secretion system GspH family protein [Thiotrichaceae bacterium]
MWQQRGFSLLEMAIAILALSLILASVVQFLRVQSESNALRETDLQLQVIREALLGFATIEERLPCPAANENGQEASNLCTQEGYLPWATLAIDGRDAWGSIFRYRIDKNFAATIPDNLETGDQLQIKKITDSDSGLSTWTVTNSVVVAIFFSVGADKTANSYNGDGNADRYAYDEYTDSFDDRLSWLSTHDLVGGMLRVGKWPL